MNIKSGSIQGKVHGEVKGAESRGDYFLKFLCVVALLFVGWAIYIS